MPLIIFILIASIDREFLDLVYLSAEHIHISLEALLILNDDTRKCRFLTENLGNNFRILIYSGVRLTSSSMKKRCCKA